MVTVGIDCGFKSNVITCPTQRIINKIIAIIRISSGFANYSMVVYLELINSIFLKIPTFESYSFLKVNLFYVSGSLNEFISYF